MGHIILRLDRVMLERKISLNQLAEQVGCQPGDILEYEADKAKPAAE